MASPNTGGYDQEFLEPAAKLKEFECPLCLLVTREPNLTGCCGQHFCQSCINRILTDRKPCPLCKEVNLSAFLHKKQRRKVLELKVRCSMKQRGCGWIGELGELASHTDPRNGNCQLVDVTCPNNCGESHQKRHLKGHLSNTCPKRLEREKDRQIEAVKQQVEAKVDEVRREKNKQLEEKDRQIDMLERRLAILERRTSLLVEFTVSKGYLSKYRQNMETYTTVDGPLFYTHPRGAKLQAHTFFCSDFGIIGVQLCQVPGEFDDEIKLPVKCTVTVHLLNQLRDQDHISGSETFTLTRPTKRTYTGEPDPLEVDYNTIEDSSKREVQYLKDDCIRCRVSVVLY